MVTGPDPIVLLAALVIFPFVCAATALCVAALRPAQREVVTSVLAVLVICLAPIVLFG